MSEEYPKTEFIGVRLPRQIIDKLDERRNVTGGTRQAVIKQVLNEALF